MLSFNNIHTNLITYKYNHYLALLKIFNINMYLALFLNIYKLMTFHFIK